MTAILVVVGGFLAGAIPFGLIIGRARGVDIRQRGSGNIGATNAGRVLGWTYGLIVLALDAAKGAAGVLAASALDVPPWLVVGTGLAAIVGHCFSPFLRGKGGKGVATALGVFAVIAPALAVVALAVYALIAGITRVSSLGSLSGGTAATVFAVATHAPQPIEALVVATLVLLVFTHRRNIDKLLTKS